MNLIERFTGKDPSALFADATSAAKARLASNVAKTAAANPEVQRQAKEGAGQAIGVWILDHWQLLAGGVAVFLAVLFMVKRRR